MARLGAGRSAERLADAVRVAAKLKAGYDTGRQRGKTPNGALRATAVHQFEALLRYARRTWSPSVGDEAARRLAAALRQVDWERVRAATAQRTGEAGRVMTALAREVDWEAVRPVAGHVSSALIAAVASGQLRVGGSLGPLVARALVDQGLAGRVASRLDDERARPPDFRDVIETTARDA